MKSLRHILTRYTAFLWSIIHPLGIWGVFAAAILDSGAVGLPIDVVVGGFVASNHQRWPLYVLMASAGSAIGSLIVYAIGFTGGEEFLRKRVSPQRFARMHDAFEKHPFWSLMFPAMLPPPTPFKAFALAAAVAEMSISHFELAIFFGRLVRFTVLAIVVIYLGPGAIHVVRKFFSHHFHWILLSAAVVVLVWWLVRRAIRKHAIEASHVPGPPV
ncbi:MAG TPA: VTT domain-containing protein [Terriglobales bacterium]|nr:VTT domain-containing protein [Terriglobales bacterium]